jgi:hypothetical protein
MEACVQLHALAAQLVGKEHPVLIGKDGGCSPEPAVPLPGTESELPILQVTVIPAELS